VERGDEGLQSEFWTDADGLVKSVGTQEVDVTMAKARKADVYALKEGVREGALSGFAHVPGTRNSTDPLTKEKKRTTKTQPLLWQVIRGGGLVRE
jgi:hypothetical protein